MKVRMCDPPSGWLYGFPKPIPDHVGHGKEYFDWLISEGYPAENIEESAKHSRFWYAEIKNEDSK